MPYLPEDLTASKLTPVLRDCGAIPATASVKKCKAEIFGVGEGLLSSLYRLELDYGTDCQGPRTLVVKLMPPDLKARVLGAYLGLFEAETAYYTLDMPRITGMLAPKVHVASYGGFGRYFLLMEDMAPAKCGDQIKGMSFEEACAALRAVTGLHAKFFNRVGIAEETAEWPRRLDDPPYFKLIKQAYRDAEKILDADRFVLFGLDPNKLPNVKELIQYMADEEIYDGFTKEVLNNFTEKNEWSQFRSTLVHGDFRADNIFCQTSDGQLKIIDYQITRESPPGFDVCYFVYGSMTTDMRRRHEAELLQVYFDAMRRAGTDLTMEELLLTYQHSIVTCLIMAVIAQKDANTQADRGKLLIKTFFDRLEDMIGDWMVLKAMPLRLEKMDDEGVTSKYTRDELQGSLPPHALKLLM